MMTKRSKWALRACCSVFALASLALLGAAPAQDTAYAHYEKARALRTGGDLSAAIAELETGHRLEPQNSVVAFDLAYAYRTAGRNDEAAAMFAKALALDPSKYQTVEDWAYALKAAGHRREAQAKFREVIDNRAKYPQASDAERTELDVRMDRVRREIAYLDRDWYATAYFVYRSDAAGMPWSATPDNGLASSQAGLEAGWRPFDEARVEVFGRGFFAFKPDSLTYDDHSLQFGVGLRWRPFDTQDFALSVERLVKAGDNARDAWLLRASYFWGTGTEMDPVRTSWDYTTVFADAAYIPGDRHYFSLYGEALQGWRFKLAPDWALTPHLVLAATRTDDATGIRHLVEGGPGLMLTHWYGGDAYQAPLSQVSLAVQYRAALADNVGADGVWVAKVVWGL